MIAGEETVPLAASALPAAKPDARETVFYTPLRRICATIIALTALCATSASAGVDPDSEYLKQVRREGHTELCRAVGKPSNRLAAAIQSAMEQDPTWAAEAAWFRRIAEAYAKAGCGET